MCHCAAGSGQQFEGAREARTDANGAKVAAVAGENTINAAAFGHSSYHPVNETETEIFELRIQLQRSGDVGRKGISAISRRIALHSAVGINPRYSGRARIHRRACCWWTRQKRGWGRRRFRIRSEADSPAARARFKARTSSSSSRTVVETRRAIH